MFTASAPRMSAAVAVSSEAPFDPVYPGIRVHSVAFSVDDIFTLNAEETFMITI